MWLGAFINSLADLLLDHNILSNLELKLFNLFYTIFSTPKTKSCKAVPFDLLSSVRPVFKASAIPFFPNYTPNIGWDYFPPLLLSLTLLLLIYKFTDVLYAQALTNWSLLNRGTKTATAKWPCNEEMDGCLSLLRHCRAST